jgi:hypothetical protein
MKMRRKKKKIPSTQSTKQEQRARFNAFKRRIHYYLKLLECEEVAQLIDAESFRFMYASRNFSVPKIRMAENVVADCATKKYVYSEFDLVISNKTIKINDRLALSPKEVLCYIASIDYTIKLKKDSSDIKDILLVEKYLENIPDFPALFNVANLEIENFIQIIGRAMTHMTSSLCWFKLLENEKGSLKYRVILELNALIPNKHMVMIDNHPRPVFPLALANCFDGPIEVSVSSDKLSLDNSIRNMPIPVYIQNHVLHRMEERLDCVTRYMREFYLFSSMEDPKIIHFKGRMLVEYNLRKGHKLGYLIVDYLNGILLVKTFLLLTNSGTPEGQRLEESSGLNKIDRQYWAIDRLSTFQKSDIKDHSQVKKIFNQAGCGSLFNELPALSTGKKMPNNQAKQMLRYLDVTREDEQRPVAV